MERFFSEIDLALGDDEVVERLEQAMRRASDAADEADGEIEVAPADIEVIRRCAAEGGPKTRAEAVRLLIWEGPCSWEDLETWVRDPEESVRDVAVWNLSDGAAGELCSSDRGRCIRLLETMVEACPGDWQPIFVLEDLAKNDSAWLELTWDAAERLLDKQDSDATCMLFCGYYEHVIPDLGLGPDDLHIRPWIEGDDRTRKLILLAVAAYMGLEEGKLRSITEALAESEDAQIAALAAGVLDGSVSYGDLSCEWELGLQS